jgi:hypothetical protein
LRTYYSDFLTFSAKELVMALHRREFAILILGAATGLGGGDAAAAQGFRIRAIAVNTTALLAQSGNPTASWVKQALPKQLARAFAAHMAPGDRTGATLSVRIDSVILGSVGPGGMAIDTMKGGAALSAGAGAAYHTSLRATSRYVPTSADQALSQHALQGRVTTLSQVFAGLLAGKWRV